MPSSCGWLRLACSCPATPLCRSATWPKEVKNIASQFVTNHTVHVFIGGVEDKLVANKAITQHVKVGSAGTGTSSRCWHAPVLMQLGACCSLC